jgi:hypothetical protein
VFIRERISIYNFLQQNNIMDSTNTEIANVVRVPFIEADKEILEIVQGMQEGSTQFGMQDAACRLMGIYERVPEARANVIWALGETRCGEAAAYFISNIVKNYKEYDNSHGEQFVEAAIEALGKLGRSNGDIECLLRIAKDGYAWETYRAKAAKAAERVAARAGSNVLERVAKELRRCGVMDLVEMRRGMMAPAQAIRPSPRNASGRRLRLVNGGRS